MSGTIVFSVSSSKIKAGIFESANSSINIISFEEFEINSLSGNDSSDSLEQTKKDFLDIAKISSWINANINKKSLSNFSISILIGAFYQNHSYTPKITDLRKEKITDFSFLADEFEIFRITNEFLSLSESLYPGGIPISLLTPDFVPLAALFVKQNKFFPDDKTVILLFEDDYITIVKLIGREIFAIDFVRTTKFVDFSVVSTKLQIVAGYWMPDHIFYSSVSDFDSIKLLFDTAAIEKPASVSLEKLSITAHKRELKEYSEKNLALISAVIFNGPERNTIFDIKLSEIEIFNNGILNRRNSRKLVTYLYTGVLFFLLLTFFLFFYGAGVRESNSILTDRIKNDPLLMKEIENFELRRQSLEKNFSLISGIYSNSTPGFSKIKELSEISATFPNLWVISILHQGNGFILIEGLSEKKDDPLKFAEAFKSVKLNFVKDMTYEGKRYFRFSLLIEEVN